jgi:hypothetical protein
VRGPGLLALADAAGELPLRERAPHQNAHPVALGDREDFGFDTAAEDRVRRLLGAESLETAPLGHPLRLHHVGGGHRRRAEYASAVSMKLIPESSA